MNAATMTGDNIALSAGWQDIPVGTTGKYDAQSKTYTMTIDPGSLPLQRLEQYHIVVSKAVETVEEVAGGTDTVIDFTVEGGPLYANIADVTVDGGPAGSLQAGDTVSIRAAVHKNDTATPEVTLALAVYAGQKLIAVELESVQMSSAEQERAIEADILLPQEFQPGDTVKAFVWNVRNGLTPISNTAVLE